MCVVDFKRDRGNTYVLCDQAKAFEGKFHQNLHNTKFTCLCCRPSLLQVYRKYSRNLKYLNDAGVFFAIQDDC